MLVAKPALPRSSAQFLRHQVLFTVLQIHQDQQPHVALGKTLHQGAV